MRTTALAVPLLAIAVSAAFAGDDYPVLVYPCPTAEAPPTVDGVLDDACWGDAPLATGFTLHDQPVVVEVQTVLRVSHDAGFVYLGVQCAEPNVDRVGLQKTARDNHDMFGNETVEVFIDPGHDHSHFYQLAFSVGGGVWDSDRSDTTWNAALQSAPHVGAGQWSVEIAIPWEDLGITPDPGTVVGLNVCRDRHTGGTREWTNWSQTKANFHDPERFGHLVLSPTPEQLAGLQEELRKGDRSGPLRILSSEGFANTSYREMAERKVADIQTRVEELSNVAAGEQDAATREELEKLVESYRARLAPIRERTEGTDAINAAAWIDLDWELNALSAPLEDAVWEARLSALLSRL